jgi:hypothetical protein
VTQPGLLGEWPAEDREMEAVSFECAAFHLGEICLVGCPLASEAAMARLLSFLIGDIWDLRMAIFCQAVEQLPVS